MSLIMIVEEREEEAFRLQKILLRLQKGLTFVLPESAEEALSYVEHNRQEVDAFFIDLELSDPDGYALAGKLRKKRRYALTPMIFLTEHETDPLEAFERFHCYSFIRKPYTADGIYQKLHGLFEALDKAEQGSRAASARKMICVATREMDVWIPVADIVSLEVYGNNCALYTENQKYQLKRGTLEEQIRKIDHPAIIRCHKSYGINVWHIRGLKRKARNIWEPVYRSGVAAPCFVSRTYYPDVWEQYMKIMCDRDMGG